MKNRKENEKKSKKVTFETAGGGTFAMNNKFRF